MTQNSDEAATMTPGAHRETRREVLRRRAQELANIKCPQCREMFRAATRDAE